MAERRQAGFLADCHARRGGVKVSGKCGSARCTNDQLTFLNVISNGLTNTDLCKDSAVALQLFSGFISVYIVLVFKRRIN